ncbi:hypothetical protein [Paraburkholderia youngii]|uniref:hypothetical protein n=1 Tax=Paraburkholderia youngii TaxID=2782701 RepID=UPI003D2409BC
MARGRAKFDLDRDPRMHPEQLHQTLVKLVHTEVVRILNRQPGRREKMRALERSLAPRVRALGFDPHVGEYLGHQGFFLKYLACDAQEGIVHYFIRYDVNTSLIETFSGARVEPHAVARCMQRLGKERLDDVEPELKAIFVVAGYFTNLAISEGWAQVGVPTAGGLFLGTVEEKRLRLRTFIRPGENDRESRWSEYRALFDGIPPVDARKNCGDALFKWCGDVVSTATANGAFVDRFPFLGKAYERREDPLDHLWAAARASAASEQFATA